MVFQVTLPMFSGAKNDLGKAAASVRTWKVRARVRTQHREAFSPGKRGACYLEVH